MLSLRPSGPTGPPDKSLCSTQAEGREANDMYGQAQAPLPSVMLDGKDADFHSLGQALTTWLQLCPNREQNFHNRARFIIVSSYVFDHGEQPMQCKVLKWQLHLLWLGEPRHIRRRLLVWQSADIRVEVSNLLMEMLDC